MKTSKPKLVLVTIKTCRQCFEDYDNVTYDRDDGFCSDSCMKEYDQQLSGEAEAEDEDE